MSSRDDLILRTRNFLKQHEPDACTQLLRELLDELVFLDIEAHTKTDELEKLRKKHRQFIASSKVARRGLEAEDTPYQLKVLFSLFDELKVEQNA